MKKVLYGVALTLFAGVSVGSLQSCKDDLNDVVTQTSYDLSKLKSDLLAADAKLQEQITANRNDINKNADAINALLQALNDYATVKYVDGKVAELEKAIADGDEALKTELEGKINGALSRIASLEEKIGGIETNAAAIEALKGKVEAQQAAIDAINAELPKIAQRLDNVEGDVTELKGNVADLQEKFNTLDSSVNELWQELASFKDEVGQLAGILQTLIDQYDALESQLNEYIGRMNALITGIVLQGTDCPVFGNFSLPIGIQSNILFNWYGYNDIETYQFPNAGSEYNYYEGAPVLTAAELAALNPELKEVKKGVLGDVNLGKLYMTINPAGHEFNEEAFKLETTAQNAYPATLKVSKSDDEMYFGYTQTRATVEGNGFYEASVIVSENDIPAARFDIEDGLKSSVEAALKDPSKRTAVELLKGVYGQLNGTLPAYAVRYDWNVNGKDYSVLSNYAIAATTAKPLSYSFLYGKGTSKHLPIIGHLDNLIEKLKDNENLKFNFTSSINFDNVKIELGEVNVAAPEGNLTITIPSINVYDSEGNLIGQSEVTTIPSENIEGMDDITEEIAKNIEDALREVMDDLNKQLNDNVLAEIKNQVDKMVQDMSNQINGQIGNFIDDLADQAEPYFKRLNRLVDVYNKVARKINNFLANPNHYLQVAMFYNQADSNMGLLSNKLSDPTVFNRANGNVGLYASSYTGEIVAPAYMKYVAVTNVYNASDKKVAANAAAERDAVNNAAKYFNTVMSGNTIRYAVPASSLKAGLIYEIVYQGVDYSGRTSTQKFYIQVK